MTIQKGDRFESKQDPGRVVQVKTEIRSAIGTWRVEVIANEKNPKTVGRHTTLSTKTLTTPYKELSH